MKTFKSCRLALALAAILLGVCPAHATITVLNYWHMGETDPQAASGRYCTNTVDVVGRDTLTNNSVGGHYPTYTNSVSPAAAAETGSSLAMVLTNGQYGTALLATNLADNFGIECWVNPATTVPGGAVLAYNGLRGNGWGLYQNGTNYEVLYGGSAFWGNGLATTGVWTHLALVRNQGVATLYVNGAPGSTFSGTPLTPSGSFTVGGDAQYAEYFSGAIDEVRVFTFAPGAFSTNDLLVNLTNLLVNSTNLWVSNTKDSGAGSLRAATVLGTNNANIRFAPALSGQTILLTGGPIELSNNVTIDASALPGGIHIDGNGAVQVFNVAANTTVILNSLTITNGSDVAFGFGGGIDNNGTATLNECTLSGNNANRTYGGGAYNLGTLTLNQCTVSGNNSVGGEGGGIFNQGTLALNQCSLSGNGGASYGGGIFDNGGTMKLNECTLSGNSANYGGGIYNFAGALAMTNTLVGGNSAPSGGADVYNSATLTYGGSNLVQSLGTAGGTITGPSPLNAAPALASLGNYGGPTQTMPPLPGSPAVGAGSVAANTFTNDQRGYARTQNGLIDIGAVELPAVSFTASPTFGLAPLTVQFGSPNTDSDGSLIIQRHWSFGNGNASAAQNPTNVYSTAGVFSPSLIVTNSLGLALTASGPVISAGPLVTNSADSGPGTLRSVITNGLNGEVITFATNLSGATISLASTLPINASLTIDASALPHGIQINGNGNVTVFNVASGITDVLNSLTIINGYTSGNGGGINNNGILTLNQCTLSGNSGASGGGLFNIGTATLNECTLSGNISGTGGGVFNQYYTLTLNQCTLSGNIAEYEAEGGGIFNFVGVVVMTNTLVGGNTSPDIYNDQSTITYGGSNLVQSVYNYNGTINGPSPLNAAPGLAALRNYGGPTQTMPPLPGSPAIGAGSVAANTFATDQRGYARTQNGLMDIGAVELPTVQPFTASPTNTWRLNPVQFNSPGVDSDGTTIAEWNWSFGDGTTGAGQNTTHAYATTGGFSPGLIVTNSLGLALAVSGPAITVSLPPNVTGLTLSGTNLTIQGTGISGTTYYVLTSTNLALPLSQWTPLSTNTWSANGVFSVTLTNALNPPAPGKFYLLKEP